VSAPRTIADHVIDVIRRADIDTLSCLPGVQNDDFDDGAYGNVKRMQQQKFGDQRTIASTLRNPGLVRYAESFGARGLRADDPVELRLDEVFAAGVPTIIHVPTVAMPDPWPHFLRGPARGKR